MRSITIILEASISVTELSTQGRWVVRDWIATITLFLATAAVVLWQNSRLAALWDLSYILENSYRISLGDVPYRDFPLAHAPATFLIQAALIKFTGRVFFHHVTYCAVTGGIATVLSWRILYKLLVNWWLAILLSAPLSVLGIYCIFPHPFYDPDCTLVILACILLLQSLEQKGYPSHRAFLTGLVLILPAFAKQNTGLFFCGSTALAVIAAVGNEMNRRRSIAGYVGLLAGTASGLITALLLIQLAVGLGPYVHWTLHYAVSRRLPGANDMLSVYVEHTEVWWWLIAFLLGFRLEFIPRANRFLKIAAAALMSTPFLWVLVSQFTEEDAPDRAELLLALWPLTLILAAICALLRLRETKSMLTLALPFVVIATVHGAFLSQQLWGSTYAIWPLQMILLATIFATLQHRFTTPLWPLALVVSVSLTISGAFYIRGHVRLNYADLSGQVAKPTLPALKGLSVPGNWIPQFEELVHYAEQEIPRPDGLLLLPGEDLFYYATGRRPHFPVLVFDYTVNPYSPVEISQLTRSHEIRWVVVKRKVQLDHDPLEQKDYLLALLMQDFDLVKRLSNYDVYRRKTASRDWLSTVSYSRKPYSAK